MLIPVYYNLYYKTVIIYLNKIDRKYKLDKYISIKMNIPN